MDRDILLHTVSNCIQYPTAYLPPASLSTFVLPLIMHAV